MCIRDRPRSAVVEKIEHGIISNYADCDYELDTFLRSLPFSYDYLRKLFQKELGVTPHKYLIDKRLQFAAEILVSIDNSSNSIADIAMMCGFRDPLYFSKMFKKKYGVAPSYYIRSKAEDPAASRPDESSIKVLLEDV